MNQRICRLRPRRALNIYLSLVAAVCMVVFVYAPWAAEQSASGQAQSDQPLTSLSTKQIGERANHLINSINADRAEFQGYDQAIKTASEEDKLVLEMKIWSLQQRALDNAHQLADALINLETKSPQPQLRKQVETIFTAALPRFQYYVNHLREEIDRLRAGRAKASADQRFPLEATVARLTGRLDVFFDMYLRHVQKMELLGMNIQKARGALVQMLTDRSHELSGRIDLALARIDSNSERLEAIPDDAEAKSLLIATEKALETNAASLGATLNVMDALGLETEAQRSLLVRTTHDYSSSLTDTSVLMDLIGRTLNTITEWFADNGLKILLKVAVVIVIILIFQFIARLVRKGLEKAIDSSRVNMSQLARRMVVRTVANLVWLIGLMLALSQLGISLGPMLAGLGVAGFIVGFALQDTLGNFASGMMILLYRPYDMGDLVEVGGVFGKVDKMSLVSTSLLTLDNQLIVIPNNKIWGDVIKNVTAQTIRRVDMVFGIAYSDDIPKAERILEEILNAHDRVLDDPEPMVRLHTLGASSVDFIVRPWVKVDDYWDVYWDVTRAVKLRFDEEGVSIPFPQRDVHVYYETQPVPAVE